MKNYRPKLYDEASRSHASKNLAIIILCFIAVFIVIFILESVIPTIMCIPAMIDALQEEGLLDGSGILGLDDTMPLAQEIASEPTIMVTALFCTVFGTIASIVYCRCIEMRPVRSMGAVKKKLIPSYLTGLAVGTLMMSVITFLSIVSGANSISRCTEVDYGWIVLYFFGFFVQGMSEEFIFRGYLSTTIGGSGHHTALAVGISSVGFALAHGMNTGFGPVPFINLALFGVFAALYLIVTESIWGICAIHSIWNFTQGNIYGISVSGTDKTESLFRTTAVSDKAILTGGQFGIEGSIFTSLVLITGIIILLAALRKKLPVTEAQSDTFPTAPAE